MTFCQGPSPTTSRDGSPRRSCTNPKSVVNGSWAARWRARALRHRAQSAAHRRSFRGDRGAGRLLAELNWRRDQRRREADYISKTYARVHADGGGVAATARRTTRTQAEAARARSDRAAERPGRPAGKPIDSMRYRAIYKLWPDFPVYSQIYRSVATIKSDAAVRSYGAGGSGIVWAVIDSGIDREPSPLRHRERPHAPVTRSAGSASLLRRQRRHRRRAGYSVRGAGATRSGCATSAQTPMPRRQEHQQFRRQAQGAPRGASRAGADRRFRPWHTRRRDHRRHGQERTKVQLLERTEHVNERGELERGQFEQTGTMPAEQVRGMAPNCRLISLRVLDGNGEGRSSDVIRALAYVRERLNDNPKLLRVHGVNLSVGYEFDAEMFACGQSPICAEVNRLVQSGVVVVAAAGNTGFGTVGVGGAARPRSGCRTRSTIRATPSSAITVGATHRDSPYTYGVSYFSSKGPTGDGRLKPDLVAPGERITSCGAGRRLKKAKAAPVGRTLPRPSWRRSGATTWKTAGPAWRRRTCRARSRRSCRFGGSSSASRST